MSSTTPWALRDSNPRPPPCKRVKYEQQRPYQHIRLTDEPPEPGMDARTTKSGVNPVSTPPRQSCAKVTTCPTTGRSSFRPIPPTCRRRISGIERGTPWPPSWSGVRCPDCGAALDDEWWSTAVGVAYEGRFRDLHIEMPCCGVTGSLNDLTYPRPVAFGRARLILDGSPEVPPGVTRDAEQVLGCDLRTVRRHL